MRRYDEEQAAQRAAHPYLLPDGTCARGGSHGALDSVSAPRARERRLLLLPARLLRVEEDAHRANFADLCRRAGGQALCRAPGWTASLQVGTPKSLAAGRRAGPRPLVCDVEELSSTARPTARVGSRERARSRRS